jgi:hypothetical protein
MKRLEKKSMLLRKMNSDMQILSANEMLKIRGGISVPDPRGLK